MLAPLFKYIEQTHHLRPSEVAERLGISRVLYHNWRTGKTDMKGWQLLVINTEFELGWERIYHLLSEQYPRDKLAKIMRCYLPMPGQGRPNEAEIKKILDRLASLTSKLVQKNKDEYDK